jgi:glutathione S-transferase
MTRTRRLIHAIFLVLLPVVVATLGLGVGAAAALVAGTLLWRWLIVLSGFVAPERGPLLALETISASHFAEKVRWCMDRLGLEYTEHQSGGTLGAFFAGRTVPQLRVRTGLVESVVGNSPEILRYLWGACAAPLADKAVFLRPTNERLELERNLDRYGANLHVWVYYHLLEHRGLTLRAWGVDNPNVPLWHRVSLRLLFPLLAALIRRAFRINDDHFAKAVLHIEELLSYVDTRLADGRQSILGGDEINYTDLAFAAFSGLWLQPRDYGGGKGEHSRIERSQIPAAMRADVDRWLEDYPRAATFIETLYAQER